jgi:hypothetical protein
MSDSNPLDALTGSAANKQTVGSTAGPKATAPAVDHFEQEEKAFKLEQMRKAAAHEDAKRALELQALELSIKFQNAQLKKFAKDEFKDQMAEENSAMDAKTKGLSLKQQAEGQLQIEKRCNHKKGGNGLRGIIGGRGDAGQYAVMKHVMSNGDVWVRCLRCGKTWKPPLERSFDNPKDFIKAQAQYEIAVDFQTLNSTSGSVQFNFSDQGQYFREQMEHVTLR